jgi:hypothetical protein
LAPLLNFLIAFVTTAQYISTALFVHKVGMDAVDIIEGLGGLGEVSTGHWSN